MNRTKHLPRMFLLLSLLSCFIHADARAERSVGYSPNAKAFSAEYVRMQKQLARGWNTWDTNSVLTHALMPEGFAINLQLMDAKSGKVIENALVGRRGPDDEDVRPGPHAYDGSYTELNLKWRDIEIKVQSAGVGDDLFLLVTPTKRAPSGVLIVNPMMLFKRVGNISVSGSRIRAETPGKTILIDCRGAKADATGGFATAALVFRLDAKVAVSTAGKSEAQIESIISKARERFESGKKKYGELKDVYDAMQSALAWNVIYEPKKGRVIAPVSRAWSVGWGGYVLFCWDTYFASYMFSLDNKQLAYANAVEITKEITNAGFVPNYAGAMTSSDDRSQPPVGSMIVREIYRRYREKWLLEEVFDELLTWNRWWEKNRVTNGLLCWGSNPYKGYLGRPSEIANVNTRMGAALESGLDNSPMYDDMPFNTKTHRMALADVGLTSMYVMDCDALADIADVLGRKAESEELRARAAAYRANLAQMWDDESGMYLNKRTDTMAFSGRMSPTNFYPFLAKAPTSEQAGRMLKEHFYNPNEFWGEWVMPSIARNDPDFSDNDYWRGRIWAPMNFLVYMGMRNYDIPAARKDLVEKSRRLLLKSWLGERHVYENYNSVTGVGDDVNSSDKFYHWGALLGFISFIEKGVVGSPEKPLGDAK